MEKKELKEKITDSIFNQGNPYLILKEYKNSNGSQIVAYKILEEIREEIVKEAREERYEDLVLEIMDVVWGWSNSSNKIWDTVLKDEDIK